MAVGTAICPTCGKSFSIDSSMVGQSVVCPWCGEEIYMEGVDAPLESDVPVGVLRNSPETAPAAEYTPQNDTSRLQRPSAAATSDAPIALFDADEGTSRRLFGLPLRMVVLAAVVLVSVVAGCWMAMRRGARDDAEDEPVSSEIQYFVENRNEPTESNVDHEDAPVTAKEDVEDEGENHQQDDRAAAGEHQDLPDTMQPVETNLSQQAHATESSSIGPEVEDDETDPFEEAEKEAANSNEPTTTALALDASSLVEAYSNSGIDSYKCKTFVRDFAKTIAAANTNATAKREDLDTKARMYLKNQMEKAQAAGNLSQVLVFKTALESARRGEIVGDDATVKKLRESYAKQLALTDKALLAAGHNAARALHASFGYQKVEATKKGNIENATKIEAFQHEIEEWVKRLQGQVMPVPKEPKGNNYRPKTVTPIVVEESIVIVDAKDRNGTVICSAMRGDVIEIKYEGGRWTFWQGRRPSESPDARQVSEEKQRCALIRRDNPSTELAIVPYDTERKLFSYAVQEDGTFALRINDGPETWDFDDNSGSVQYTVRLIRGKGGATPSADLRQSQGGQSSAQLSKTVTVDARDGNGAVIGTVRRGDTVEFKYEGGKWSYDGRSCPRESPDAKAVCSEEQRCVIVKRYNPEVVLAILPSDTQYHPYSYVAGESGELALRMYDGRDRYRRYDTGHFNDNGGSVRYSVKILPASSVDSSTRRTADVSSARKAYGRAMPIETSFAQFKDDLALWYDFGDAASLNEDRTLVSDKSGGGNDGKVTGATWKIGGNGNGCFYFDGLPGRAPDTSPDEDHDFIRVTDSTIGFPLQDFTISVVCNPQNNGAIIGTGQNELWCRVWLLNCEKFEWWWKPGYRSGGVGREGHTVSFPSCLNACSHIVVKRTGDDLSIYCNGTLKGMTAGFGDRPLPIYSYGLFIGNEEGDEFSTWRHWSCMRGEIYQVLIWKRALSDAEVSALSTRVKSRFDIR